nr:hypothetical protein [Tanacetum cinerariifolium]
MVAFSLNPQEMLKTLGYKSKKNKMYYHFKIPNNNLDHGLQALGNDADVINLKLRLEEIDDVESSALARKPFKKPGLKVNRLPQLLLEGPSLNDDVEVPSFNEDENGIESNEEAANEEAANEDETGSESSESDDSKDSDDIVDEDNVINEVDVDMQEFYQNIDKDVEWVGQSKGNVEVPAHVDVEEGFDLDDFDMDTDCESDVESSKERERALRALRKESKNKHGHFYVGQEFADKKEATTLVSCQVVAIRRQLYVWKNDKLRVRAVCRGKYPNSVGPNASGLNSPNKGKLKQVNGKWVKSKTVETSCSGQGINKVDGIRIKYPGQLLTDVGIDANHGDDLDLNPVSNFTFISDRQRFKDLVWKCVAATTVPYFDKQIGKLKNLDSAYEYLQKIPPQHWSRSHFGGRAHCDVLLNNLCEVFNRQLMDGRDVPIITCLEFVRDYLMKRVVNVKKVISMSPCPLTPAATKLFEAIKYKATFYMVLSNGGTKYQASGPYEDQCVVDMEEKNCSCRKWELTGMPYKHAVVVINEMTLTNVDVEVPESFVHSSYWVSTWTKQYNYTINPINGRNLWSKHPSPYTIIPPKIHPQIRRPPKSRKKIAGKISSQKMSVNGKLTRVGKSVTCGKCGMKGHNRTSCKGSQASEVGGSQASKVEGSQASKVGGSQALSVEGSKASSVGVSKRTKGSQTGTSSAAKRSKLF